MRHLLHTLLLCLVSCIAVAQPSPASFGRAQLLNDGWRFNLGDDSTAIDLAFNDRQWQYIRLPHDWSVSQPMSPDCGSCQGYLPGGIAWYRRCLKAEEVGTALNGHEQNRKLYIYFEGIYNRSSVYLNGHLLGYRPNGYASLLYELTPYLRADGENILAVRVDHSRQNDSRWYTGSGINRPVWLVSAPATHIAQWGTSWTIKSISDKKAVVEIAVETSSTEKTPDCSVQVDIMDAAGKVVASARGKSPLSLSVRSPHRWTLSDPYLYQIRARLFANGKETDQSIVPLGLRTLTFSPDKGFALNGEWMKVKGVCVHDDAGVLGTAVPADVWKRRLVNLKAIGVNAIRMSHNPHTPALYDLCDSLGLLVMDEASDEWEYPKRKWLKGWNQGAPGFEGSYDFFEEWIERDVADMVRRDRCHPSIFLWSIGNEVDYPNDPYSHPVLDGKNGDFTQPMYGGYKPEQPNAERIGLIAQRLARIVRGIDSSRAVTGALAGVVMSNETAYPYAVDVVGYNYTESRYADDHQRYPNRVIYGSENRHDLPAWKAVRDNEHIFGQFLWTGIDYLGESGRWPARGSEAGLLDLAGNIKPLGHYRAALWSEQPVCYIGTYPIRRSHMNNNRGGNGRDRLSPYATATWNYEEGQRVRVVSYTNAASARLFLNGQPVGGAPQRDEATDILFWDIDYTAGVLRCEADNKATAVITTCGRPYALRATCDKSVLYGRDEVAHITIEVTDENGNLVPMADNDIFCNVNSPAKLLGLENGDIRDTSDKSDSRCRVHGGRLIAYVSPRGINTGSARLHFTSPLLKSAEVEIQIAAQPNK